MPRTFGALLVSSTFLFVGCGDSGASTGNHEGPGGGGGAAGAAGYSGTAGSSGTGGVGGSAGSGGMGGSGGSAGSSGAAGSSPKACGNEKVDTGETCDGDCPASCDDGDACTSDTLLGSPVTCSARCDHKVSVASCINGDDCCPSACDRNTDSDCPYYVDATSGSDSYDGLSPAKAWKTVAKVNTTKFLPGDHIAFKRGEVWRESLEVSSTGQMGKPIVFQAYGMASSKPVFSPTKLLTSWTLSNKVFVADYDAPVSQVLVDGERLSLAHYPNKGYLYIDQDEPTANKTSFLDAALTASKQEMAGADIYIRSVRWQYDYRSVADFVDHRVTVNKDIQSAGRFGKDTGYILGNKLWMLDSPGEWFHDASNKKLYIRLSDDSDPAKHAVEVPIAETGIWVKSTAKSVVLNGLESRFASVDGIRISQPSEITVKFCTIDSAAVQGIYVNWPYPNAVIRLLDNEIRKSGNTGIGYNSDGTYAITAEILRNRVFDTMPSFPIVAMSGNGSNATAITMWGASHAKVMNNHVRSAGYNCFSVANIANQIEQNVIENCCQILDDCGGIYLGGEAHSIKSNILRNMIGNSEGSADFFKEKSTMAQGIYPDEDSHDIVINGNTIINADLGIQIHDSNSHTVTNNVSYLSRRSSIYTSEDPGAKGTNPPGYVHSNTISGNLFFPNPGVYAIEEFGALGQTNFGTYSANTLWHVRNKLPIVEQTLTNGTYSSAYFDVADWPKKPGIDLALSYDVVQLAGKPVGSTELIQNGGFDSNILGWTTWPATIKASWVADCGLSGGCLHTIAGADSGQVTSTTFNVIKDHGYELRFGLRSNGKIEVDPIVRRPQAPWDDFGLSEKTKSDSTATSLSYFFIAKESGAVRLDLGQTKNTEFWIDNVSVREVNAKQNNPNDDYRILVNTTAGQKPFDLLADRYCASDNSEVAGLVVLEPYSSKVLLNCFCNGDSVCNNKETPASCPSDCP